MAVLDVLEEEKLQANALTVGDHVRVGLERLASRYDVVGGVRGRGLFFGIDLEVDGRPDADLTKRLVNDMRDRGVLLSRIGRHDNVLKMRPPLVFTIADADHLLGTLDDALGQLG